VLLFCTEIVAFAYVCYLFYFAVWLQFHQKHVLFMQKSRQNIKEIVD